MLYKYYRYMLLIKVILLLLSIFMLREQRNRPVHNWGTLFLLSEKQYNTSGDMTQFLTTEWKNLPTPWAVLSQHTTWTTIHIPWTYDTWYVIWYLWQPLPPVLDTIDETLYIQICKYKVITEKDTIKSTTCHIDRRVELLWTMLLLVVGLLL